MLGLDLNITPEFKPASQAEKMVYESLSEELDDIIEMHRNIERTKYNSKNPSEIYLKVPKNISERSLTKEDSFQTVVLNLKGFDYNEKRFN